MGRVTGVCIGIVAWASLGAISRAADENLVAREVLQLSGVRAGLCLHLGCGREGSTGLTAALAESGSLSVHGIALDEAAMLRARDAIEAAGLSGKALVECIPVNPLPYLRDLANLVVVEDMAALSAKGLTHEEILRVTAPNGSICVRQEGKWVRTVKPRPEEMDDWTHPFHGADGNTVSNDKLVSFPLGVRWIDGLPLNVNSWASCRGIVVAGGRCYSLSSNVFENLLSKTKEHYLVARDAFNGLPLWKLKLGTSDDGAHLQCRNVGPIVADNKRVYAGRENDIIIVEGLTGAVLTNCPTKYKPRRMALLDNTLLAACWAGADSSSDNYEGWHSWATWLPNSEGGTLEALDANTGEKKWSVSMPAYLIRAADGVVYVLTHTGTPKTDKDIEKELVSLIKVQLAALLNTQPAPRNTVAKFGDAVSEHPLSEIARETAMKLAADIQTKNGKDLTDEQTWKEIWKSPDEMQFRKLRTQMDMRRTWQREVVALDLKTGKEKWRAAVSKYGEKLDLELGAAGPGYVLFNKRIENVAGAISAADGSVLWRQVVKQPSTSWTPVVDGLVWCRFKKLDPVTGQAKGTLPVCAGGMSCTMSVVVNNIIVHSRHCNYEQVIEEPNSQSKVRKMTFTGARGACMTGMVPANGMFYTAQNNCLCYAGHIYGFLAIGPSGGWPTLADYQATRPIEKGPAFGKVEDLPISRDDWPSYRHDATRSAGTTSKGPTSLKEIWKVQAVQPGAGPLAEVWKERIAPCITAPVCAGGMVFVAGTDSAQVLALDAASGKKLWNTVLGARIDTPPTVHGGVCLIGAHDGWVYALRAKDGQLVYRTRVAPWERRIMAYGQVESVWPTVGTIMVHNNIAYAIAGRSTESDGGIALLAFNPTTGAQKWGQVIAPGPQRQIDLLSLEDGALACHHLRFNLATGAPEPAVTPPAYFKGGIMDGTWTLAGGRRAGRAFIIGKHPEKSLTPEGVLSHIGWNESVLVTTTACMPREKADATVGLPNEKDYTWRSKHSHPGQVEALALSGDRVFYSGRTRDGGFVRMAAVKDGKVLNDIILENAPAYDGLAVAGGKVYLSLENGTVYCFGE